jgi:RNA polymerase sigma-70 factor, ECF subfamily
MKTDEYNTIQAVLRGEDTYRELVERYHPGLIIHCDHILKDRDEAEDIAQEAFVKAYLKLADYNPSMGRFSTWLYRIATNLALNKLKQNNRKMDVNDIELLTESTMPTYLEDERKQEIISAVIKLMPPEYRRAVEAYYWQGLSYQDIADELGVPLGTLKTWMRRAKQQLKGELA